MKDELKINGFSSISENEQMNVDGGFASLITISVGGGVAIAAGAAIVTVGAVSMVGSYFGWW